MMNSEHDRADLGDLCELRKEQCDPAKVDGGIYVGLEHIDSGRFFLERHGSPSDVRSAKSRFYPGDVLYGKLRPYLDKAVVADQEGICSTDILVLTPKSCPSWFLCGVLHTKSFIEHANQTTHGVNHPRTSWANIRPYQVLNFPLPVQQKIAAILEKIQRAIRLQDKIIQTLRDLKQSTLRHLFTCGARSESFQETPYGNVPKSWGIVPLSDCAIVQTGVAKGRAIDPSVAIEVPYLRVANVQAGHLDLSEVKTIRIRRDEMGRYALRKDDVVVTEGGDFDKLGRGFIWEGQVEPCVHQNHIFAIRPDRDRILPLFFTFLIQSPYGRSYFLSVAHKTTNLACINTTKLKAFPVPIPSITEQEAITHRLHSLDRSIEAHEAKKHMLQNLCKVALSNLLAPGVDMSEVKA